MRYYVNFVEMTVNGENRTQPFAYDTLDEAMAKYHNKMGQDISAESVVGAHALVWNSAGAIHVNDLWGSLEPVSES